MIPSKDEPDYIKKLNLDIETALREALREFCKSSGTELNYVGYRGFTMSHHASGQIDLDWEIQAIINHKPEIKDSYD